MPDAGTRPRQHHSPDRPLARNTHHLITIRVLDRPPALRLDRRAQFASDRPRPRLTARRETIQTSGPPRALKRRQSRRQPCPHRQRREPRDLRRAAHLAPYECSRSAPAARLSIELPARGTLPRLLIKYAARPRPLSDATRPVPRVNAQLWLCVCVHYLVCRCSPLATLCSRSRTLQQSHV